MAASIPPDQWLQNNFPDLSGLQLLSHGGQKHVFSAGHPVDGDVVLKILKPTDLVTVEREILAVQKVASPRVPTIFAHGSIPGPLGASYWIREQRIVGPSVRELIKSGSLSLPDLVSMTHSVLEALAAAEREKIVHRDVKPDNMIRDALGNFWLIDFGLARHLTLASATATALPFGKLTLGYAPPEQTRNIKSEIDSRADLFALGVTIVECATGIHPFWAGARDELEVLKRVESFPLQPLMLTGLKQPRQFADLVSAMTQKRRDQRLRSVSEALVWVQEIRTEEGI